MKEHNNIEIQSLKDTVYHLESHISDLCKDKIRIALNLLDTEDHMFGDEKYMCNLLKGFNFSDFEIKHIIEEVEKYRLF